LTLRALGRAAHASTPQIGENAIEKILAVIEMLRGELSARFGACSDETSGPLTFNLGMIQGGSKINIVPELCEAQIDIRTLPGQDLAPLLDSLAKHFAGVEFERRILGPLETDPAHPFIRLLESCGARCIGAPWFCDAAFLAAAGTPAVALGPGSMEQAHTADEWISLADLQAGVEFFKKLLGKLKSP
jgi:acetylornithine deacetylase/succinyl-diaminopimelate desuccinylase-like protein